MYSQNQGIIGTSSFPRSDGFVRGYADLDKMYKNLEFEYGS